MIKTQNPLKWIRSEDKLVAGVAQQGRRAKGVQNRKAHRKLARFPERRTQIEKRRREMPC
jgi:hypothetical protein